MDVTYMESEECIEYGALVNLKGEVFQFSIENENLKVNKVESMEKIKKELPQVNTAIRLLKEHSVEEILNIL